MWVQLQIFLGMRFLIRASDVFQELRHFDVLTPFMHQAILISMKIAFTT